MQKFKTIPDRISLPHSTPEWLRGSHYYFITICCEERSRNTLANNTAWSAILETHRIYGERKRWGCITALAIPDHLHMIVTLPDESSLKSTTVDFKRAVACFGKVRWQRDFFDHRIRDEDALAAKSRYILENPVRAGLVSRIEEWPFRHMILPEW